jgi:hypothetical protein
MQDFSGTAKKSSRVRGNKTATNTSILTTMYSIRKVNLVVYEAILFLTFLYIKETIC